MPWAVSHVPMPFPNGIHGVAGHIILLGMGYPTVGEWH